MAAAAAAESGAFDASASGAAGSDSANAGSSLLQQHLRRMRLEDASFRLGDPAGTGNKLESENGVVLTLSLTDASKTASETVDVALSAGELHKLLTTLRSMTGTIASLTQSE